MDRGIPTEVLEVMRRAGSTCAGFGAPRPCSAGWPKGLRRRRHRVGIESAVQPTDLDIYASIEPAGHAVFGEVQELVAGEDALRMLGEGQQQAALSRAEVDGDVRRGGEFAARRIQRPAGELEQPTKGVPRTSCGVTARRSTARTRARSSRGAERLGECSRPRRLQSDDAVGFLSLCRKHDDRHRRLPAHFAMSPDGRSITSRITRFAGTVRTACSISLPSRTAVTR